MARILIVEDEAPLRKLVHLVLSAKGHDVDLAANAREALALCRNGTCFDLVLTNIRLPEMDGHELTRRIAAHYPPSRILHMSADDPGCNSCPYAEKCPLLSKPFKPDALLACVDALLAQSPPRLKQN